MSSQSNRKTNNLGKTFERQIEIEETLTIWWRIFFQMKFTPSWVYKLNNENTKEEFFWIMRTDKTHLNCVIVLTDQY